MSLISKFASLFGSSQTTQGPYSPSDPRLEEVLSFVMKPSTRFNIKSATSVLTIFLVEKEENIDLLFQFLSQTINPSFKYTSSISIVQLLSTLHCLFTNQELQYDVAVKLKESKISFMSQSETLQQEKKGVITPPQRRIETEGQQDNSQFYGDQFETALQLPQYAKLYHTYLQRIAANVDLYRSVSENLYPYMSEKDYVEPKLMFLWHYKIQNLLNTAIPLLVPFDLSICDIQKQIWTDIYMFQKFLCLELQKIAGMNIFKLSKDSYATLPNADTLSLYEIFSDSLKHSKTLEKYVASAKGTFLLQSPPYPFIPQGILQDFLGFASKLKVLNQFTFKRSIKVPNKLNPCMGIPTHNPNLRHLRSTSGKFLVKQDKQSSPLNKSDPEQEIVLDSKTGETQELNSQVEQMMSKNDLGSESEEGQDVVEPCTINNDHKKQTKKKLVHNRGFSTFQQK